MAGRRTNLALLGLLAVSLATGTLAFGVGAAWGRWVAVAHGAAGLALVVLGRPKSAVVRRGLRRRRAGRGASIALGVLVVATVLSGLAHSAGLRSLGAGVTAMQFHVGSALGAIPLAVWHVVARPARPRRTDLSRRTALRAGGVLGAGAAVWLAAEGSVRAAGLPGAGRRFTGSYEAGSGRPSQMPVTQWLGDRVQDVDPAAWRLTVTDASGARTLSLDDLARHADRVRAVLDCTGGWYAEQDWTGVRLDRLIGDVGDARSVVVTSATGYARRFPVRDLSRLVLATAVGGAPLTRGHGYPLRLVAAGRRGFWWVKWVTDVRVDAAPWWAQPPFPLQ